jgi:hypothetical protein
MSCRFYHAYNLPEKGKDESFLWLGKGIGYRVSWEIGELVNFSSPAHENVVLR